MSQESFLVSAIVSTFNAERFIRGCIEDLERQTLSDKTEIIIVDSGSEQNEGRIIRQFQQRHANLRYIRTDTRETVYAAWNRGIQAAHGRYVTNANTDDRHRPDAFERMVALLDHRPDVALVYADVLKTETENETFDCCTPTGRFRWYDWDRNLLLTKGCFMGPQPMWRRSVHDLYGYFDETLVTSGDYEFWLRISQTLDFHHIRLPLGLYLESPYSIEHRNRERQHMENKRILARYRKAALQGEILGCRPLEDLKEILRNESCSPHDRFQAVVGHIQMAAGLMPATTRRPSDGHPFDSKRLLELKKIIFQGDITDKVADEVVRLGAKLLLNRTNWFPRFHNQPEARPPFLPDTVKPAGRTNLGDGDMLTVEQMYEAMQPVLQTSRPGDAVRALQNVVRFFPDFARAHNDLGTLYYQSGEKQKAIGHFERAASISPQNADFQKNLADYYCVEMNRAEEALRLYARVLEVRPNDIETLMTVGHILVSLQRFEEADAHYRRVLEIEPWNPQANEHHNALCRMGSGGKANGTAEHMYAEVRRRLDLGDPAGARQQLEKMLTVYPHVALVHNDLAVLYYQSGDKVQALRHYEEAVKLQSGNLTFQKNLADFYYIEQGRIQDALKAYIRILETTPQDIETLLAVGKICKELHETDDARTFFTRVLEIEPWNHSAAENLNQLVSAKPFQQAERRADEMYAEATRLSSSGDIQAASMALERLVGVHPDFALAYNDLGVLSYQAGEKQAALKYHQRAVQLEPANLTFQKNLADCYWIGFGRLEDALKIYTGILSAHPEDVETLLAIGKACLSTRQPDDARVMFDRVLEIEPWNAEARQQLKELNALNRAA